MFIIIFEFDGEIVCISYECFWDTIFPRFSGALGAYYNFFNGAIGTLWGYEVFFVGGDDWIATVVRSRINVPELTVCVSLLFGAPCVFFFDFAFPDGG